jgi:hypothetical protein
MAVLWALLLALFLQTTTPVPTIELVVGLLLGLIAGHLQDRALAARPGDFLAAHTAMGVRRAMFGLSTGKTSTVLKWVNSVGLLIWAMAYAPDMFIGAWLAGVAAFGFARELAALPGVLRLSDLQRTGHGS